jgi:folate-binding protein YgfZ
VASLAAGTGCYAAMLTAQGRMITDMRVLELGDAVLLDVPAPLAASVRDHLERFVFSEDVQVEDRTASLAELGLYGPGAQACLAGVPVEGGLPSVLHASTRVRVAGVDATAVAGDQIGIAGFDLLVEARDASAVAVALSRAGAATATAGEVETVRVESGRPWFGRDMDTDTIPLEAGIEARAISRTKGCYVGQEVIVRVQDRGHGRVARRLAGLTFEPGAGVSVRGSTVEVDDREVGRVTSAVWSPSLGRPIALGYLHRDVVEPGTHVRVGGVDGVVAALPFV